MVMHTFSPELANSLLYDRAEAKLLNPTIVGLLHRNNVAVDAQLLANARKAPESTDDVAANRAYVLIFPFQTRQRAHLVNSHAAVHQKTVFVEPLELSATQAELIWQSTDHLGDDVLQGHNTHVAAKLINHHS